MAVVLSWPERIEDLEDCPDCKGEEAEVDGALTVVCAWRHTHAEDKHLSGPPAEQGASVSHGICPECLAVELEHMGQAGEGRMSRVTTPWTLQDHEAEESALDRLGPEGQARVLRDYLRHMAAEAERVAGIVGDMVDLAALEPAAVNVAGYVLELDARGLIDTREWRVACRQEVEERARPATAEASS